MTYLFDLDALAPKATPDGWWYIGHTAEDGREWGVFRGGKVSNRFLLSPIEPGERPALFLQKNAAAVLHRLKLKGWQIKEWKKQ